LLLDGSMRRLYPRGGR